MADGDRFDRARRGAWASRGSALITVAGAFLLLALAAGLVFGNASAQRSGGGGGGGGCSGYDTSCNCTQSGYDSQCEPPRCRIRTRGTETTQTVSDGVQVTVKVTDKRCRAKVTTTITVPSGGGGPALKAASTYHPDAIKKKLKKGKAAHLKIAVKKKTKRAVANAYKDGRHPYAIVKIATKDKQGPRDEAQLLIYLTP